MHGPVCHLCTIVSLGTHLSLLGQYKAVQAMMVDVEKMAALYNVELIEAAVKPVVVVRGSKVLKMSNFMVWRDRYDFFVVCVGYTEPIAPLVYSYT